MANQITIDREIAVTGINVYNGKTNHIRFIPNNEDSGLVFIVKGQKIPAKITNASNKRLGIAVTYDKKTAYLTEHLLSAVYGLGIDNLMIELSDGVCPTVPNGALEFAEALKNQRTEQGAPKKYWKIDRTFCFDPYERPDSLLIDKSSDFKINYEAFYPHKCIGKQDMSIILNEESYMSEVCCARPNALHTVGNLWFFKNVLSRVFPNGVNEETYLLIASKDDASYTNPDHPPRYISNNFVRHKLMDVIGTLALTGRQFKETEFTFHMSGHKFDLYALNRAFNEGYFIEDE